nr:MAG TPA: hypothetical protein [Caudoviricetes sp.]
MITFKYSAKDIDSLLEENKRLKSELEASKKELQELKEEIISHLQSENKDLAYQAQRIAHSRYIMNLM